MSALSGRMRRVYEDDVVVATLAARRMLVLGWVGGGGEARTSLS